MHLRKILPLLLLLPLAACQTWSGTNSPIDPTISEPVRDLVDNWPTDRPRPMRQNRALGYALNAICNWLPGTAVGWRHDADPGANSSQRMRGRQIRPVVGLGVQPAMTRA